MKTQNKNFLKIVKAGMCGICDELESPDWDYLYTLAETQSLIGIYYHGCVQYPSFKMWDAEKRNKLSTAVMQIVVYQSQRNYAFYALYEKLLAYGLKPLVLKGIVCRNLYGKFADYRPSGDEDLYILPEEFDKYLAALQKEGFHLSIPETVHMDIKDLQEVAFDANDYKFHLELHPCFFGRTRKFTDPFNSVFGNVYENAIQMEIDGHELYSLGYTDHYLYLFLHLVKHFTGNGVGIRQSIDLVLFGKQYEDKIDWDKVNAVLRRFSLTELHDDIYGIGVWIGLCNHNKQEHHVDDLIDDSLEGGIFGLADNAYKRSGVYLNGEQSSQNKLSQMLYVLFPGKDRLQSTYTYLNKHPFLLPVAWIERFYRVFSGKYGDKVVREAYQIAKKRKNLMKKYHVIQ